MRRILVGALFVGSDTVSKSEKFQLAFMLYTILLVLIKMAYFPVSETLLYCACGLMAMIAFTFAKGKEKP